LHFAIGISKQDMATAEFIIDTQRFSIETLKQLTQTPHTLKLDSAVVDVVSKNRAFLDRKLAEPNARYYGINTGFGALCDVKISNEILNSSKRIW
jgi:histidine ammonia-lyase